MTRFAVALLLLVALPAMGQDNPSLALRLSVSPEGPVWIGQRVTVTLTVMTPIRFATPPPFPDLAPQGKAVVLPETTTVPGIERIERQTYASLQRSYLLFPAGDGKLVLPPLRMTALVGGSDGRPVEANATVPGATLAVRAPPGVNDLTRLVVTPELQVNSSLDRAPQGLHVGDAITRTIRIEAVDTAAMLLPSVSWGSLPGFAIYPDPPILQDRLERGELHALRVERTAFVPQRAGPATIPGVALTWLEPRSGRIRVVTVDPITFEALPAAAGTGSARSPDHLRRLVLMALALLATMGPVAMLLLNRRTVREPRSAQQAFAALAIACRAGDAAGAIVSLFRWCDAVLPPQAGSDSVQRLATLSRTPALLRETRAVEDRMYGTPCQAGGWDGRPLAAAARAARRKLGRSARRTRTEPLPELNPHEAAPLAPRVVLRDWAR